jgi:hypothetical protein
MAYDIKIKGFKDPMRVDEHEKGEKLKVLWKNYNEGKGNNTPIEIGGWLGRISDVGSFMEVKSVNRSDKPQIQYPDIELTPEQRKKRAEMFDKARQEFIKKGIFKGKGKGKYQLKKSELDRYEKTYGRKYPVRDDMVIIDG